MLTQVNKNFHRCPRCNRYGTVVGYDDYYGIIYECACLPVCWAIDPKTGEKVEGC